MTVTKTIGGSKRGARDDPHQSVFIFMQFFFGGGVGSDKYPNLEVGNPFEYPGSNTESTRHPKNKDALPNEWYINICCSNRPNPAVGEYMCTCNSSHMNMHRDSRKKQLGAHIMTFRCTTYNAEFHFHQYIKSSTCCLITRYYVHRTPSCIN